MFIRFVRPNAVDGMNAREGFFCAAYELREDSNVDQYTADQLEGLLAWFRKNLAVPQKFSRSKSKAAHTGDTKGLSWFKSSAKEPLEKSFELIALLEENGFRIEILRSERIGYVIYEDENQVIAEPFSDTPK